MPFITRQQILLKSLNGELNNPEDWKELLYNRITKKDFLYFDKFKKYKMQYILTQKLSQAEIDEIINSKNEIFICSLCDSENHLSNQQIKDILKQIYSTLPSFMRKTVLSEDILLSYYNYIIQYDISIFVNTQRISIDFIKKLNDTELRCLVSHNRIFKRQRFNTKILDILPIDIDPITIKRLLLYQNVSVSFLKRYKKDINRFYNDKFIRKLLRHNRYTTQEKLNIFKPRQTTILNDKGWMDI